MWLRLVAVKTRCAWVAVGAVALKTGCAWVAVETAAVKARCAWVAAGGRRLRQTLARIIRARGAT